MSDKERQWNQRNNDKIIIVLLIVGDSMFGHTSWFMSNTTLDKKEQLKVVIADDSAAIRKLLKSTLMNIGGIVVSGMAEDGINAIQLVKELKPDLLLLDISMPHMSGIEVLRQIREDNNSLVIIMFSAEPAYRDYCLSHGANFFQTKTEIEELLMIFKRLTER